MIDIVVLHHDALTESEEFIFGYREMQMRLPDHWRTYSINSDSHASVVDILAASKADYLLLVLNPALIVSDNLAQELDFKMNGAPDDLACLVANNPRLSGPECVPDYATRPGFDRFVARLSKQPEFGCYRGGEPWLYMVKRSAVEKLNRENNSFTWTQLPLLLGSQTAVSQHVFVHSYVDYYLNNRAEMFNILPKEVDSLLDIGGGEGNFVATFLSQRGGRATLLEQNRKSAQTARKNGFDVIEGTFLSVQIADSYDCVSMLDVLEHTIDPLAVLEKIHNILHPGGYLLLSVPNAGHWPVVSDLLEGYFDYQPVGILCNTHVRFFTQNSLRHLLAKANFTVEQWSNIKSPLPSDFIKFITTCKPAWLTPDLDNLSTNCFHVLARRG